MNHPVANVILLCAVAVLGYGASWVIRSRYRRLENLDIEPWAAALSYIATAFGVVVGFCILLMFGQFADAREAVGDEATSVGTAFEEAGLFPESGPDVQQALVCYAEAAVRYDWPAMRDGRGAPEADAAFADLVQSLGSGDAPATGALHAAAATNLLSQVGSISTARETRLVAAETNIPFLLWSLLVGGGLFVVVLVFMVTMRASRGAQAGLVAAAAVFTAVMVVLVVALSAPFAAGAGRVSPRLLEETIETMRASPNGGGDVVGCEPGS